MHRACAIIFCFNVLTTYCFYHAREPTCEEFLEGDPGQPLILTPLIKAGKIQEAQEAAEVNFDGFKHIKSYAGYFTVNEHFNSNTFFWFFPSLSNYQKDPVVVWLQGGPGASSLIGLFLENGPFILKPKHGLKTRKFHWAQNHSVIYIDNPVGAGYSFTTDGYAQNQTVIGNDLYNAISQFMLLFPKLQENEFYISGESYAGKYAPALGYAIFKNNPSAKVKINLQGLTIGNGLCDPENQLIHGDYLYQIGLINSNTKVKVNDFEHQAIDFIHKKQWKDATDTFDRLFHGSDATTSFFQNVTGFTNNFNYLIADRSYLNEHLQRMSSYIQRSDIRAAIHVGNITFDARRQIVDNNLAEDFMQSIAPWLVELLSHYRVLIYSGQLDIIIPYPTTVNFLENLKFNAADDYKNAERYQWHVGTEIAGFVKQAGNLTEVLVRNAGHLVPHDQPQWALDLITRFTRNQPFH